MIPDLHDRQAELVQLPVRKDNYIYLLRDHQMEITAVIDPAEPEPVMALLKERNWQLNYVLNTHHHQDHTGANLALKAQTGCAIIGYEQDAARIPGIDVKVREGAQVTIGRFQLEVIFLPGHTLGHIAYYSPDFSLLFCGDVLFSMGCGRLFEGSAGQMWKSLQKIKSLPKDTLICCAHEYSQHNAAIALKIDPHNPQLHERINEVDRLRAEGEYTVPVPLYTELQTNPFLRSDNQEIRYQLDMLLDKEVDVFARIREIYNGT